MNPSKDKRPDSSCQAPVNTLTREREREQFSKNGANFLHLNERRMNCTSYLGKTSCSSWKEMEKRSFFSPIIVLDKENGSSNKRKWYGKSRTSIKVGKGDNLERQSFFSGKISVVRMIVPFVFAPEQLFFLYLFLFPWKLQAPWAVVFLFFVWCMWQTARILAILS